MTMMMMTEYVWQEGGSACYISEECFLGNVT